MPGSSRQKAGYPAHVFIDIEHSGILASSSAASAQARVHHASSAKRRWIHSGFSCDSIADANPRNFAVSVAEELNARSGLRPRFRDGRNGAVLREEDMRHLRPRASPTPWPVTLSNNLHEHRSVLGADQHVGKRAAVAAEKRAEFRLHGRGYRIAAVEAQILLQGGANEVLA